MEERRPKAAGSATGRRHPWPVLVGLLVLAVVLAGAAVFALWHGSHQSPDQDETGQRVATVERTSLVAGFKLSGTLGYGDPATLDGGGGVVTRLPEAGQLVPAGQVVMEVEGAPVILLQGDLPLWREIGPGVTGVDVAMVRAALAGLGLEAGPAGGQTFDQPLSDAIGQLYAGLGYERPPLTADQQTASAQAETAVDQAEAALTDAQVLLDQAKARRPGEVERLQAEAGVNQAQSALNALIRGQCGGPPDQGAPAACPQSEIQAAEDALAVAIAQRDALARPPDVTAEQNEVDQAARAVDRARADYEETLANRLSPQTVLTAPEAEIRIDSVTARLGLPADGPVLTWTHTTLTGQADLTDAQRQLLTAGDEARLTLPDGQVLAGTISGIAQPKTDPATGLPTPARATIELADQAAAAEAGPQAVTVTFVQETAEDTLVVPVTALMALAEGGYCVERPDGSLVAVEVGLVADTRAQVFSDQLSEGDEVVVP